MIDSEILKILEKYNLSLVEQTNSIIRIKGSLHHLSFFNNKHERTIDTEIVDDNNNVYTFVSIKIFFSKTGIKTEEFANYFPPITSQKEEYKFIYNVLATLKFIESNFDFILTGDFSWSSNYFAFWEEIKILGKKILNLEETNALRIKYLSPFVKPLDWLEEAKKHFEM